MLLIAILLAALACACVTDMRARLIPDWITGPAALVALVAGGHVVAGAAAGGFLGVAALVRPDGMGLGDAKLAAVIGLCLGPPVLLALLVACLAATLYGLAARARAVPFAPFLALGALMALF